MEMERSDRVISIFRTLRRQRPARGAGALLAAVTLPLLLAGCGSDPAEGPAGEDRSALLSAQWSALPQNLGGQRDHAAAVRLNDGRILVTGGGIVTYNGSNRLTTVVQSVEVYDPATSAWSYAAPMHWPRYHHRATLLADGRVFVSGGPYITTEIYDPATNTWSNGPSKQVHRNEHASVLLHDGRVMLVGGVAATSGGPSALVDLYDPANNSMSAAPPLAVARYRPAAAVLPTGEVLVSGGASIGSTSRATEVYDPATNAWRRVGDLVSSRYAHTLTPLPDGRVFAVGGTTSTTMRSSTESYNPLSGVWSSGPSLSTARAGHSATMLPDGLILVAGGAPNAAITGTPLASTEIYDPFASTFSAGPTMVDGHASHWAAGGDGSVFVGGSLETDPFAAPETATFTPSGAACLMHSESAPAVSGTHNWQVLTADVNNDGKPDLFVAHQDYLFGNSSFSVHLGRGDGSFDRGLRYASPAVGMAVGDFDGDGNLDVATCGTSSSSGAIVSVRTGRGTGAFRSATLTAVASAPRDIAAGDVNNDGKLDLVTISYGANRVSVLLGNGDGTFQSPLERFDDAVGNLSKMRLRDMDGDGKLDLVIAGDYPKLAIERGNGDGTFQPPIIRSLAAGIMSLDTGDLDGDGKLDVVAIGSQEVNVLHGNGDGTLQGPGSFPLGASVVWLDPNSVAVGDGDGDGKLDVAVTLPQGPAFFHGNGDGTLSAPAFFAPEPGSNAVTLADVDGDAHADLVYSRARHGVRVLRGGAAIGSTPPVDSTTGLGARALVAGDFNGDGNVDVAMIGEGTGRMGVHLGTSSGYLAAPVAYDVVSPPLAPSETDIAKGDFNGDGALDLAVQIVSDNQTGLAVFLGSGSGTFAPPILTPLYLVREGSIAVGDLNGDGKLDAVLTEDYRKKLIALLGNGDGHFTEAGTFATGSQPVDVELGDVDGDGKLDAVTTDYSADKVGILHGNGDGTFTSKPGLSMPRPRHVGLADVNGAFQHSGIRSLEFT